VSSRLLSSILARSMANRNAHGQVHSWHFFSAFSPLFTEEPPTYVDEGCPQLIYHFAGPGVVICLRQTTTLADWWPVTLRGDAQCVSIWSLVNCSVRAIFLLLNIWLWIIFIRRHLDSRESFSQESSRDYITDTSSESNNDNVDYCIPLNLTWISVDDMLI